MAVDLSHPDSYTSQQTALLLLDFHKVFFEKMGTETMRDALKQAANMKVWAESHQVEIVHGVIDFEQPSLETGRNLSRWTGMIEAAKAAGTIVEEDAVREQQPGTEKLFGRRLGVLSALHSPGLEQYLRQKNIKSLLIAGISTSGCVLRTTFNATDLGFVVTVVEDACADPKQSTHDFVVENFLNNHSHLKKAEEVQQSLEKAWQ